VTLSYKSIISILLSCMVWSYSMMHGLPKALMDKEGTNVQWATLMNILR